MNYQNISLFMLGIVFFQLDAMQGFLPVDYFNSSAPESQRSTIGSALRYYKKVTGLNDASLAGIGDPSEQKITCNVYTDFEHQIEHGSLSDKVLNQYLTRHTAVTRVAIDLINELHLFINKCTTNKSPIEDVSHVRISIKKATDLLVMNGYITLAPILTKQLTHLSESANEQINRINRIANEDLKKKLAWDKKNNGMN